MCLPLMAFREMVGRRCGKYPTSSHINEPFEVVSSPSRDRGADQEVQTQHRLIQMSQALKLWIHLFLHGGSRHSRLALVSINL